jgi:hypothetical protein
MRAILVYGTRLALPAATLLAVIAAWLSQGVVAATTADGSRIAMLPVSAAAFAVAAAAGVAVVLLARAGASLAPISLLGLLLLPWLPLPVPAAVLVWAGSIRWLVWTVVAVAVISTMATMATMATTFRSDRVPGIVATSLRERPRLCAGVLSFLLFAVAAWQVSPSLPGADEPHYLVITQSLLLDGDLKIENNHRRGDYRAYFHGPLRPHFLRRGRDREIYSIHAPGLSVVVAPAFAIGGYRAVVLFLLVVAALGSALSWHVSFLVTRSLSAAWFGWAAVTCSAPEIFQTFSVFPDGIGGVLALTGVWALLRAEEEQRARALNLLPWFVHGAALALLPWLHSRFALLAGSLGALVLLRLPSTKNPMGKAVAFLSVPAVSAICWIGFFIAIYGTPDPSAPYGSSQEFSGRFIPGGLSGLLFDQRFGLLATAPVLFAGFAGLVVMLGRGRTDSGEPSSAFTERRLAAELLFVMTPYLVTATSYAMWWGGSSAPARFAAPVIPMLAIPCAVAWNKLRDRATRAVILGALVVTGFISAVLVLVDGGRLAFNARPGDAYALWLDWASRLASLGEGMPGWSRGRDREFFGEVNVWVAALGFAWLVARAVAGSDRFRGRGALATAVAAIYAAAAMVALTAVWTLHGASGLSAASAQLEFLRRVAKAPRALQFAVQPPARLDASQVPGMLRIEAGRGSDGSGGPSAPGGRGDPALVTLPSVPAGRYRIRLRTRAAGGWVMIGIGQDQFALRTEQLAFPPTPIDVDFPVDVRALIVRGDEDARRSIRSLVVEPVSLVPVSSRLTNTVARQAIRYASSSVFFLDEFGYAEPEGFWTMGGRRAMVVMQADRPLPSLPVIVRNGAEENRVTLESGGWREALTLAAGEERQLHIPLAPGRSVALVAITTSSGFRPSAVDPSSGDNRFLGIRLMIPSF